jgi:hypothetical protein
MEAGWCTEDSNTDEECGRRNKCQRSGTVPPYAQCIKRVTRWSVITTEKFHS